jgi:hypothetical protein
MAGSRLQFLVILLVALCVGQPEPAAAAPASELKIVLLRHAEKPEKGEHLSCQGQNRALQLPAVLERRFGRPDYVYVPAIATGRATKHARMFETISPFAIKENLVVDSKFAESDVASVADEVLALRGTVLMVWEHSQIVPLARALGVAGPLTWPGSDFDSIWVITFQKGRASMSVEKQDLAPAAECGF